MLNFLYPHKRYRGLQHLLNAITDVDMGRRGATLGHLENVQLQFEGLLDVFEKQTRSPGIRSCYDLNEIRTDGDFVLMACSDLSAVLSLHLSMKALAAPTETSPEPEPEDVARAGSSGPLSLSDATTVDAVDPLTTHRVEEYEYMQDLRAKLIMTEVPEEIAQEMPIAAMIESYVDQLQVLSEMRDAVHMLYTSGHFRYQGGYRQTHKFSLSGLPDLRRCLATLQRELHEWEEIQHTMRNSHYFLNVYRMREILRLTGLLEIAALEGIHGHDSDQSVCDAMLSPANAVVVTGSEPEPAAGTDPPPVDDGAELTLTSSTVEWKDEIAALCTMGFPGAMCVQAIRMTHGNRDQALELLLAGAVDASSRAAAVDTTRMARLTR